MNLDLTDVTWFTVCFEFCRAAKLKADGSAIMSFKINSNRLPELAAITTDVDNASLRGACVRDSSGKCG